MTYTRVKKTPPKKPCPKLYEKKTKMIEKYKILEEENKIDIYYFDESGFSISSNLPYLWSEINNTTIVKTLTCKRINVLGFLSKKGKLKSFIAEGRVNSDKVVEVFNQFVDILEKPTIVILEGLPLEGIMHPFIRAKDLKKILLNGQIKD